MGCLPYSHVHITLFYYYDQNLHGFASLYKLGLFLFKYPWDY